MHECRSPQALCSVQAMDPGCAGRARRGFVALEAATRGRTQSEVHSPGWVLVGPRD